MYIHPVTILALIEFSELQLCGTAFLVQAVITGYEAHLQIIEHKSGAIRLAAPGHTDYPAALDAIVRFAQMHMEQALVSIPMYTSDGSLTVVTSTLISGLYSLFPTFHDASSGHWVALKECAHRICLAQARGSAVSLGPLSSGVFLTPAGCSKRGPFYKLKPLRQRQQALGRAPADTATPFVSATCSSSAATCALGHGVQPFVDTWTPCAHPEPRACFACYEAIVERCVNGPISKVQYDHAWWDVFLIVESLTKSLISTQRKAALHSLRMFAWMSREWVEVKRAAASMVGVPGPNCPVLALHVARLMTHERMLMIGTSDVDVVMDRMRESMLLAMGVASDCRMVDGVFDWVESFESSLHIESRQDFEWYHLQYQLPPVQIKTE